MIVSILGWFGAGLYLLNHAYLALKKGHESALYYWLNLIAAVALVVSSAAIYSWQPVITNAFWVVVSALALLRAPREATQRTMMIRESWVVWPIAAALSVGAAVALGRFYLGLSIIGWGGTVLFSTAYLMFATGAIARPRFLIYNAIAAFALAPILFLDANWPVFALEIVWGITSLAGWRSALEPA
ncbi:MAG: hypothetical protein AB8G16_03675 [Gammaproteobacteria bacterium]